MILSGSVRSVADRARFSESEDRIIYEENDDEVMPPVDFGRLRALGSGGGHLYVLQQPLFQNDSQS
jgi:hypothetical protein